jgi:hypothetical protein
VHDEGAISFALHFSVPFRVSRKESRGNASRPRARTPRKHVCTKKKTSGALPGRMYVRMRGSNRIYKKRKKFSTFASTLHFHVLLAKVEGNEGHWMCRICIHEYDM